MNADDAIALEPRVLRELLRLAWIGYGREFEQGLFSRDPADEARVTRGRQALDRVAELLPAPVVPDA